MEEVVKQLTAQVPMESNWPYTLVCLKGNNHQVPVPRKGHLSAMVEGTSSVTCGWISHLEVHQLLSSDSQVIYPVGLNGCEVPVIAFLPKSLPRGTTLLGGKPIYLKVDIPYPTTEGQEPKVLPLSTHSSPIQVPSPVKALLPKVEREVSMTMEVRELLSWVVLDTSGQESGNSAQKRLNAIIILTPPPPKLGDFSRLVEHHPK